MIKKKKESKKRAEKYKKKLSIDGTLDEVLKVSVPRIEKNK
jgi:dsDNA-binding SOS-regulon protein